MRSEQVIYYLQSSKFPITVVTVAQFLQIYFSGFTDQQIPTKQTSYCVSIIFSLDFCVLLIHIQYNTAIHKVISTTIFVTVAFL